MPRRGKAAVQFETPFCLTVNFWWKLRGIARNCRNCDTAILFWRVWKFGNGNSSTRCATFCHTRRRSSFGRLGQWTVIQKRLLSVSLLAMPAFWVHMDPQPIPNWIPTGSIAFELPQAPLEQKTFVSLCLEPKPHFLGAWLAKLFLDVPGVRLWPKYPPGSGRRRIFCWHMQKCFLGTSDKVKELRLAITVAAVLPLSIISHSQNCTYIYMHIYTADRFAAHHPLLVFAWAWILVCLDNHQLILHWKPLAIVDWMVCASYIIIAWDGGWIMTRFALLAPWVNKSGGTAAQGRPGAHSPIQISLTTLFNHVKPQKIFIAKAVFVMNQRDSLMFDSADSSRLSWSLPELLRTT